jgi:BMFP domain-containing protein YqiC
MLNSASISEISNKIREIIKNSPAGDLEKNINALLKGVFTKMELISREEFDIQTEVLRKTREKLEELEAKQAVLEAQISKLNQS